MNPSLRELEQALSIRRQIDALEKRLSAILEGSRTKPKVSSRAAKRNPSIADRMADMVTTAGATNPAMVSRMMAQTLSKKMGATLINANS
jgi:hypothetical protein